MTARALTIAVLAIAAGCTVGPDFKTPERKMPGSWIGTAPTTGPTTVPTTQGSKTAPVATDVAQWWRNFNDPQLDDLVHRAIGSNLDLRQAASRVRQARAQRGVAYSGLWPTVDLGASYRRQGSEGSNRTFVDPGTGVVTSSSSGGGSDLYRAGLDAAWELDIFGGIRRGVEASDADILAAIEDHRDVLVTLTSEVALNYIDLRGLQRELVIARDNVASQERSADVTRRRQRGGFISSLDVANAEAQVASTKSQIPVIEQQAQQTIYNIALLLGVEPRALLEELTPPSQIPLTPSEVPVGLPSDLLKRRPDIRRAEAQWHAATARVGEATADLFPKFNITGSVGTNGSKPASLLNWNNGAWAIGPGVTFPLFNAGRIRSNIAVQNELQQQAATSYEQAVLIALRDVESALTAYAREQQHRAALQEAVTANVRAVSLATTLYTQGQTDFLNVINAQRSLYLSQDALVQSDRTVATNLVSLYKALGGGWEAVSPATQPAH